MNEAEKNKLFEEVDSLLEIFRKNDPVKKDGTFDSTLIKYTTQEMLRFIVQNESGLEKLFVWMENNEYWSSPASTRFHGNVKGGLAAHSLMVAVQALYFAKSFAVNFMATPLSEKFTFSAEDIMIAAVAHDFCKAGSYLTESKRVKDFAGNWTYEPYYKVKQNLRNLGHGNESVLLLLESMPEYLEKRYVIEAVSRHMGFSDLSDTEKMNYSNFLQNPLVVLLQLGDETAAQWWQL